MADLEIEGTFDEQWGIMKSAVRAHDKTLYGNGQPGIVDFIAQTRGQFKLIIALLTLILTALGVYAALEANRQSHAKLFPWQQNASGGVMTASKNNSQNATIPSQAENLMR